MIYKVEIRDKETEGTVYYREQVVFCDKRQFSEVRKHFQLVVDTLPEGHYCVEISKYRPLVLSRKGKRCAWSSLIDELEMESKNSCVTHTERGIEPK